MKFSVPIVCPSCSEKFTLEISGSGLPEYSQCPKCGVRPYNAWPLGNAVTILLMERSKQELANGDVTIAILLISMAVEGQMAFLFFKWKAIGCGKLPSSISQEDRNKWESEWRNAQSFRKQLDELSKLLTKKAFDEFAVQNKKWFLPILGGFEPAKSIKEYFQKNLYDTRIRVIHYGEVDFQKADGERCVSLGQALIRLFHAMDRRACEILDDAHKSSNSASPVAG